MPENYVYLKNLSQEVIKPRTDLAALDLTTVNGIAVLGNTMGIADGYIESAYYMNMVEGTNAAHPESAYIDGSTIFALIGGYTVSDNIDLTAPDPQKVPNEVAVANVLNTIEAVADSNIHSVGDGITVTNTVLKADFATPAQIREPADTHKVIEPAALQTALHASPNAVYTTSLEPTNSAYMVWHYDVSPWGAIEDLEINAASLELYPGHYYKVYNTTGPLTVTVATHAADVFGANAYAEIYNADTGYIALSTGVSFATPLTNNAINDCIIRFRRGKAEISVLSSKTVDYTVTVSTSSGDGSLDAAFANSKSFIQLSVGVTGAAVLETAIINYRDILVVDHAYAPVLAGAMRTAGNSMSLSIVETTGNIAIASGTMYLAGANTNAASDITITSGGLVVSAGHLGSVLLTSGSLELCGAVKLTKAVATAAATPGNVVISSGASIELTSSLAPGGTGRITVAGGTCYVNNNLIGPGTYTSINSAGVPTA